jgi:hypothetical protein
MRSEYDERPMNDQDRNASDSDSELLVPSAPPSAASPVEAAPVTRRQGGHGKPSSGKKDGRKEDKSAKGPKGAKLSEANRVAENPARTAEASFTEHTPAGVVTDLRDTLSSRVSPDDISIPPASTDDLDEHDERFFAEGEAASQRDVVLEPTVRVYAGRGKSAPVVHIDHFDDPPPPTVSPARQRKLANYVKAAVGFSAVLCIAALVRVGVMNGGADPRAAAAAVAPPVTLVEPAAPPPVVPAPPPVQAPAIAAIPPIPPIPAVTAPAIPDAPAKSAREEKDDARRSLERGKAKDAVASAGRSVAIDPTDADAWLILGAAQQEMGRGADAHASFVSCVKQAKKGEVGECGAMLTWNGPR